MLQDDFLEGLNLLGRMGLSFDAWCYHTQVPEFVKMAQACPDVTIILDHFGGPLGIGPYEGKQDQVLASWRDAIGGLAEADNVYFKLGGINMKINGFGCTKDRDPQLPTSWWKRPRPIMSFV